jgi:selenide, water dikinase
MGDNEDAAVLSFPPGKALIQTVDFFTPVVNDPFRFGQIAAANALSDVYAMGGNPFAAMNIVCFPAKCMPLDILKEVLRGGLSKILEAGAAIAGGHSVDDAEIKYGLAVSGVVDPNRFASNGGLKPGDRLLLTKPLGTGVLATAVKANVHNASQLEETIWQVASRLNVAPGAAIQTFGLMAATDVTGFGLGGHALEMSQASGWAIELTCAAVPLLPEALDLASKGYLPAGSHSNRRFFSPKVAVSPEAVSLQVDLIFDAQTSGGLLLAVPESLVEEVKSFLVAAGDMAVEVGSVITEPTSTGLLRIL